MASAVATPSAAHGSAGACAPFAAWRSQRAVCSHGSCSLVARPAGEVGPQRRANVAVDVADLVANYCMAVHVFGVRHLLENCLSCLHVMCSVGGGNVDGEDDREMVGYRYDCV